MELMHAHMYCYIELLQSHMELLHGTHTKRNSYTELLHAHMDCYMELVHAPIELLHGTRACSDGTLTCNS